MLDYEKKWHFDKHYENLKKFDFHVIVQIIFNIIFFTLIYSVFKYILVLLPDITLYKNSKCVVTFLNLQFFMPDFAFMAVGIILFCYGKVLISKISDQNCSVRTSSDNSPTSLLVDGYYKKVRHPMYGAFIITQMGILFSLRSLIATAFLLVVILIQYFNAFYEEKKDLIPKFNQQYIEYKRNVKGMLLKKWQLITVILLIAISLLGLLIK